MPSNRRLEFADVDDFTPGYFSVGDWLMPANGSQEMKDCRPDPGGGLRAAIKPGTFSTSGIPSTARCIGLYVRGGIAGQAGSGLAEGNDYYLAVYDTATPAVKIYRWNGTLTVTPTSWTLIKTHTTSAATPNPVIFDTFVDSAGANHVLWTLAHSTDSGLYSLQFSYQAGQGVSAIDDLGVTATQSVTQRVAGFCPAVAVQDDRAITAIGARFSTLRWCASQDITSWPAANNLPVQASRQGAVITLLSAFAPGDLLAGQKFAAWTFIQGSITDPVVRTMSDARYPQFIQRAAFTDSGLAFISGYNGIVLTSTGDNFQTISDQLDPATFKQAASSPGDVGVGELAYSGNLLLAPHGLFRDDRTQAWHRSSVLIAAADHFHSWADLQNHVFLAATGGSAFSLYTFDATERGQRWNTYTWKGAPLRRPDGRQVEVREVQVYVKSYDDNASVTVTVNGTARVVSCGTAGRQQLNFLFSERAEVLDVQVVPTAASSAVEAPSIEVVRIGTQSRHTLL